jgi:hypothetical protein
MSEIEKLYDILSDLADDAETSIGNCWEEDRSQRRWYGGKFNGFVCAMLEILRIEFEKTYNDNLNDVEKYMQFLTDINYKFLLPKNISGDYKEYLSRRYYSVNFYKFLLGKKCKNIEEVISIYKDCDYNLKDIKI